MMSACLTGNWASGAPRWARATRRHGPCSGAAAWGVTFGGDPCRPQAERAFVWVVRAGGRRQQQGRSRPRIRDDEHRISDGWDVKRRRSAAAYPPSSGGAGSGTAQPSLWRCVPCWNRASECSGGRGRCNWRETCREAMSGGVTGCTGPAFRKRAGVRQDRCWGRREAHSVAGARCCWCTRGR